jgi:hypothetical protein
MKEEVTLKLLNILLHITYSNDGYAKVYVPANLFSLVAYL